MKANELMLGDWVLCDGKPYRIAEIGGMVCLDYDKELFAALEDIAPIPLTAEILEKNGFYHNGLKGYNTPSPSCTIDYGEWGHSDEDGFIMLADGADIKYIHQLQNALRICGVDRDIVI